MKQQINYSDISGAIILKLIDHSPAQIGGLLVGDIILKVEIRKLIVFMISPNIFLITPVTELS